MVKKKEYWSKGTSVGESVSKQPTRSSLFQLTTADIAPLFALIGNVRFSLQRLLRENNLIMVPEW